MSISLTRILILADLEGSSACWSYAASSFLTDEWARACLGMSKDVSSVVGALFEAGVESITVKNPRIMATFFVSIVLPPLYLGF